MSRVTIHNGTGHMLRSVSIEKVIEAVYERDSALGAERDGDPWAVVAVDHAEQALEGLVNDVILGNPDRMRALAAEIIEAADEIDRLAAAPPHPAEAAARRYGRD